MKTLKESCRDWRHEQSPPLTGSEDIIAEQAFMAGCAAGLRKAAGICDDQTGLYPTLRNAASKAQAEDIKIICLASAGRVDRGEYENSVSSVESLHTS